LDPRKIEDGFHHLSINHNGLIIPGRSIESFLAGYCTGLGVWTDNDEYPIYIRGSATLLKYKGRYFLVCTRHQLDQTAKFENVCLMKAHGLGQTECITSGGARWFNSVEVGDHQQVVIFDFTEPCLDKAELKPMFFDFQGQHPDMPADKIVTFLTYGYPTDHGNFDYENGRIEQVRMQILSRFAPAGADTALHIIDPIANLDFDPDGISGGPTFCIVLDGHDGFSVHLAGITVRGSRTRLMVIKAGAVQAMLDTVIRDRAPKRTGYKGSMS
jgi:hypothetical protein